MRETDEGFRMKETEGGTPHQGDRHKETGQTTLGGERRSRRDEAQRMRERCSLVLSLSFKKKISLLLSHNLSPSLSLSTVSLSHSLLCSLILYSSFMTFAVSLSLFLSLP